MKDRKIKVRLSVHAFERLVNRSGIASSGSFIENMREALSYGKLEDRRNGLYLNFPLIGGQMALEEEGDHYVATTFMKSFGTYKGKDVNVEYLSR